MSFFDDLLPMLPAGAGAGIGSFFGNPMLGASLGGMAGNAFLGKMGNPYDNMTYVGPPPGQGFTPTDFAAMEKARRGSERFAQGREGAREQRMASTMGGAARGPAGYALSQEATQAGAERFSDFGTQRAGIATERDMENRKMLNEFNLKHTMLSADYGERQHAADVGNRDNLFSDLGAYGLYNMMKKKPADQGPASGSGYAPSYDAYNDQGL